jgi:GTP cyclohydrolase IA
MAEYDLHLGNEVADHLKERGIETPMNTEMVAAQATNYTRLSQSEAIELSQFRVMSELRLDMKDDSLHETPKRVAKMYCSEIFTGLNYENFPKCTTIENKMGMDEMIAVRNADVLSVCEHHFVPFVGYAAVGYIPSTKVLGLSKINRIVDFFSRRPQVQERLTLQIYETLCLILETVDIAVVIKAEHLCVRLRGVKQESETITSKMGGKFMDKPALREEFLALVR